MNSPLSQKLALVAGDAAILNSGSPEMQVESVQGDDVNVLWDGASSREGMDIPAASLTKIERGAQIYDPRERSSSRLHE